MTGIRIKEKILTTYIDALDWATAISRISAWAQKNQSRYICICNVHSVVTATQDDGFKKIVNDADMATPDGAPVAWMLRKLGHYAQGRINGPDLMWKYCAHAESTSESIYLYGSTESTLEVLQKKLLHHFPALTIAGAYSPPFRQLSAEEDAAVIENINLSGANTVWVSLGCPKQEKWMADHRGKINAVMIGVGAAFDYHAGVIKRAPSWMQNAGLEWFYRLCTEPRRLWKRYLVTNSLFILKAFKQLVFKNA